ncbi:MAG: DUF4911 domain-containing protein [Candidatus Cloacimonetes bacterium]|jgi:hypothetical protein|nr:DUF4911 domain-containing protein [Candidatus Cloacimonadota bacterium]MDD4156344.1 DUF4911 domain-containing protein [Candidatus Cloacimonadota bacterium]
MINYQIIFQQLQESGDMLYHILIPPKELILFGYILESLEGWAFYTTIDTKNSILLVEVIKDYVNDFKLLIDILGNK